MARLIAIDWDQQELRLAAGVRSGSTISVDLLVAAPFPMNDALSPDELEARVSEKLKEIVQANGLGKLDVVITAGRAAIELRSLVLPQAEDPELPDMVRFQAQRTFAQMSDNSPLDFIKLPVENAESIYVLAASMNPVAFAKSKRMADQAGLVPKRMMLRPMASVAMAMAAVPSLKGESVLIVNVIGDEADLLIAEHGTTVLIRTARLPSGDEALQRKSLASEIKRTRIASESQTPAVRPTRLAIWGTFGGEGLAKEFEELTGLPTTALDLRSAIDLKAKDLPTGNLDRFAPVAGLLLQATHADRNAIDFMEPRKRPDPESPVRKFAFIGGTAAAVLLLAFFAYYRSNRALDLEIEKLTKENAGLNKTVEVATKKMADFEKVEKFLKSDYQWLDELAILSEKSPSAEAMMIYLPMTLSLDNNTGKGSITGSVVSMETDSVRKLNDSLKDGRHAFKVSQTRDLSTPNLPYHQTADLRLDLNPVSTAEIRDYLNRPSLPKPPKSETAPEAVKDDASSAKRPEGRSESRGSRGSRSSRGDRGPSPSNSSKPSDGKETGDEKVAVDEKVTGDSTPATPVAEIAPEKPPAEKPTAETKDLQKTDVEKTDVEKQGDKEISEENKSTDQGSPK